jgi:hypothetical protein
MYGHSPGKLFVRIMRNGDVKVNEFSLFSFSFLCIVFIALYRLFVCRFIIILCPDGIKQILVGFGTSPVDVVRFRGKWLISVVGSKIQKKIYHFQLIYIHT